MALQLIRTFKEVFAECGLPLWARHYDVLVTSNRRVARVDHHQERTAYVSKICTHYACILKSVLLDLNDDSHCIGQVNHNFHLIGHVTSHTYLMS